MTDLAVLDLGRRLRLVEGQLQRYSTAQLPFSTFQAAGDAVPVVPAILDSTAAAGQIPGLSDALALNDAAIEANGALLVDLSETLSANAIQVDVALAGVADDMKLVQDALALVELTGEQVAIALAEVDDKATAAQQGAAQAIIDAETARQVGAAAATAASDAQTSANEAEAAAVAAGNAATGAQETASQASTAAQKANAAALAAAGLAETKGRTYAQPEPPVPVDLNGLWIDTDDKNRPYRGAAGVIYAEAFEGSTQFPTNAVWSLSAAEGRSGGGAMVTTTSSSHRVNPHPATFRRSVGYTAEVWLLFPNLNGTTQMGLNVAGDGTAATSGYAVLLDGRGGAAGATNAPLQIRIGTAFTAGTTIAVKLSNGAANVQAGVWYRMVVDVTATAIRARIYSESGDLRADETLTDSSRAGTLVSLMSYNVGRFDDFRAQETSRWVEVRDQAIVDAANAAATAQTRANQAADDAAVAATAAGRAQQSADGKSANWYLDTAPAGTTHRVGDSWWNLANDSRLSRWSGSAWVAVDLGASAIAANAITEAKLAANAVTVGKILDGAVQEAKLAASAVTEGKLAALAVTAGKLAAGSVVAGKVAADAIVAGNIAANAITAREIVVGTITAQSGIIADAAIGSAQIADLAVTSAKISALDAAKITTGTLNAARIGALSIDASKIAASAVTTDKLNANAVTAAKIAALTITAAQIAAQTITGAKIAAATITAGLLVADAITARELAADAVVARNIKAGEIVAGKLATDSVVAVNIAAGAIVAGKLAAGAVTADTIAANAITSGKIAANQITATHILAGTITATELAAGAITAEKLAADAITGKTITGGTITGTTITGAEITGTTTITGATIRTSTTGQRVEIANNRIQFWSEDGSDAGLIYGVPSESENTGGAVLIGKTPEYGLTVGAIQLPAGGLVGVSAFSAAIQTLYVNGTDGVLRYNPAAAGDALLYPVLLGEQKGTTTVTNNTWLALNTATASGTTHRSDGYGFGSGQITVPRPGIYEISATVLFAGSTAGNLRGIALTPDGGAVGDSAPRQDFRSASLTTSSMSLTVTGMLKVSGAFNVRAYQNTGANMAGVVLSSVSARLVSDV